jgi:hypothetical protein
MNFLIPFITYILALNITFFYLDDFKLSTNKYLRLSQILSPLLLVILVILFYYYIPLIFNSGLFLDDPNKNPSITEGANIEIGKDAATEISKGISNVGSNIGLAGTVGAVTAGVAKSIGKSTLPPVQKAGIVVAGSLIGAGIHIGASFLNRLNNSSTTSPNIIVSGNTISSSSNSQIVVSLLEGSSANNLANLIFSINMLTYAYLTLTLILSMIILFKISLGSSSEENIKLNFSSLIGNKWNNNLNYY